MQAIAEAFDSGGGWMYVIAFTSVVGLGIIVERFIFLFFKYNINANAFMGQIQKLVMANNIDRAIKLCNAAPNAALPKVIKAGLTRANKGEMEIANAIEEATLEVVPIVQKRTPTLGGVANVATLLGLLGTIVGLIQAFSALESAAPDQRAAALAKGISVAMNTTAFGLIVAIPCMTAQMFLQAVTTKILNEIDQYSVKLENLLVSRYRAGGA
ncbi:MAG: MotA/TolQ/ExbB proton channel family protein [Deltaproteobacteria bacterium]|jgi:biopolymer transport protein ExbB/TolQ|nr:MotA/TolQ/ExbB proton channel family protein [Deltaproteobacteria bacterium]